jgi:hypothetical protein
MDETYPCDIAVRNHLEKPFKVHIEDLRERIIIHIYPEDGNIDTFLCKNSEAIQYKKVPNPIIINE